MENIEKCKCCIGIINDYENTTMVTVDELKSHAHAHRMNISEYLRWLIDKQRKEDEGKWQK